jgi:transaldolase
MKFYIDTASINEIRKASALGILDGVTTNPSLIAREKLKSGNKFIPIVTEICKELGGIIEIGGTGNTSKQLPVSIEVLKTDAEGMVEEGLRLAQIAPNVVVKLPCTEAGLIACHALSIEGIRVNMTLCFSTIQALLVAKAGASYVSPFIGRVDDVGDNGLALVAHIRMIYANYGIKTEILAASIRNPYHINECARIGVDIVTVPFGVISGLMEHPLTAKGLQIFLEDAKNANTIG